MNRPRVPLPFPRDQSERIAWLNSSGESIPAFACVKLFSYDDATNQFQADKPDGSEGLYYANGPATVATDKYSGSACWNLPRRCLLDATTYEVGDQVGPVSGQWGMGADGTGWRVLRPPNASSEAVVEMFTGSVKVVDFFLGEDLAAAVNPRNGWTTARAFAYAPDESGDLVYTEQVIIGNRFTGISGALGQYGTAVKIMGRLFAQTLDCEVDPEWEAPEELSIDAAPGPGDD